MISIIISPENIQSNKWALWRGNLTLIHANNKCADQLVHPGSLCLTSAFVIHFFDSKVITELALCGVSIF